MVDGVKICIIFQDLHSWYMYTVLPEKVLNASTEEKTPGFNVNGHAR